jgi:hypothetical protein
MLVKGPSAMTYVIMNFSHGRGTGGCGSTIWKFTVLDGIDDRMQKRCQVRITYNHAFSIL